MNTHSTIHYRHLAEKDGDGHFLKLNLDSDRIPWSRAPSEEEAGIPAHEAVTIYLRRGFVSMEVLRRKNDAGDTVYDLLVPSNLSQYHKELLMCAIEKKTYPRPECLPESIKAIHRYIYRDLDKDTAEHVLQTMANIPFRLEERAAAGLPITPLPAPTFKHVNLLKENARGTSCGLA